jgi:hypothetical protein
MALADNTATNNEHHISSLLSRMENLKSDKQKHPIVDLDTVAFLVNIAACNSQNFKEEATHKFRLKFTRVLKLLGIRVAIASRSFIALGSTVGSRLVNGGIVPPFLTSALDGVVSFTPLHLYPKGKSGQYSLNMRPCAAEPA